MSTQAHILILGKLDLMATRVAETRAKVVLAGEEEDNLIQNSQSLSPEAEAARQAIGDYADAGGDDLNALGETLQNAL